jgi:hypothetical protein
MRKSFVLELHGEWSESADECIDLVSAAEVHLSDSPTGFQAENHQTSE